MKTVKHLFKKCKDSGQSEYLALHSHRRRWNEPSSKADGKAVQNTTTNGRKTVIAKVRHRRRHPSTTGRKAVPEV